jgi:sugar O-acyltransferase (sialic acid O-acetyltransferase NeuD family)
MANEGIFVYGAGGHGRVVVDTLSNSKVQYRVSVVVDDDARLHGEKLLGHVIRSRDLILGERGLVAIGENSARLRIAEQFRGRLVSLVHRTAFVAQDVPIGEGSVLMANTVVTVGARIGDCVIVNTGATIDHDCLIGDGAHIAPGCHLCGSVEVGVGAFLGVGCLVVPGVRIGRNAFINAGQTITRNVPDGARVRGSRIAGPLKVSEGREL